MAIYLLICFVQNYKNININIIKSFLFFDLQATFVCTQTESSIPCEESERYYVLNEEIGKEIEEEEEADQDRGKENTTKISESETVSKKSFSKNSKLLNRERLFRRN